MDNIDFKVWPAIIRRSLLHHIINSKAQLQLSYSLKDEN